MAHNGHLVQTGLTVEQDNIVIAKVAFHNPTLRQQQLRLVLDVPKVDAGTVTANNVFGTGMLRWTIRHQLRQFRHIVGRNLYRNRQIHGHRSRYTDLMNAEIGIGRYHRTRAEIYALAHQIATNTTFLALQTLCDGLERTTRSLRHLRHAPNLIVHERRHVVLQRQLELFHNHLRFTVRHGVLQR